MAVCMESRWSFLPVDIDRRIGAQTLHRPIPQYLFAYQELDDDGNKHAEKISERTITSSAMDSAHIQPATRCRGKIFS